MVRKWIGVKAPLWLYILLDAEADDVSFLKLGFIEVIAVRLDDDSVPQAQNAGCDEIGSHVRQYSLNKPALLGAPHQCLDTDRDLN